MQLLTPGERNRTATFIARVAVKPPTFAKFVFTARRCASAVYAIALCLFVSLYVHQSVRNKPVLCQNG